MSSVSWNEKLYSKMVDEQETYKKMLMSKTPEEILEHAYEYSLREDFICSMEYNNLPESQAEAIIRLNLTMDDMVEEFRHNCDWNDHMDAVWRCVEQRGNKAYDALLNKAKSLILGFCMYEYSSSADFSDLTKVDIAYTSVGEDELPLQVYVDLVNNKICRYLDGAVLDSRSYSSLGKLIENELDSMDFQELVSVSDEDIEKVLALKGGNIH